jgi:hypothetical protein
MRFLLLLIFTFFSLKKSEAQFEEFELYYSSTTTGSVKIFWEGNIKGNKSQPFEKSNSLEVFKLKWSRDEKINKVRAYFYFPPDHSTKISKVRLVLDGDEYILKGEDILKVTHFNYQLNVNEVSSDELLFSRSDLSGNSFLEFTSTIGKLLDQLEKSSGSEFKVSAKSEYDFISKAYTGSLDSINYSQLPSIVFLPKGKDFITEFAQKDLSSEKSITFHISKKGPVDLTLFEINDIENVISYSDTSLYQRLSLSNNLSLQFTDGQIRIKRNEFNDDFALVSINLDPKLQPNHTYHLSVFSSKKGNSVIKTTLYDDDTKYSYSEFLDSSDNMCEFLIYSKSPIEKLVISFISNGTNLAIIDSVIITDESRKITEKLLKKDFRYHISESKKVSHYETTSNIFSYDVYLHNLFIIFGLLGSAVLLLYLNSKILVSIKI